MPQGIEIKTLDDLPGFSQQQAVPGMQIAPLGTPTQDVIPVDNTMLTPAWDPNEAIGALKDIRNAQTEAIRASSDALAANTLVQQRVYDENVQQQNIVMEGYDRLQKIADNPIADLFALFDPKRWSKQHQLLEIEKANLRANQATMRGQAQININNQLPALKQTQVELAQQGFQNQKDVFGIVKDISTLTNQQWETRLKATDIRLKLNQEQRTLRDDALKAMTVQQAKTTLKQAQAGKGDWAGLEGLLEDKIDRDERADLDIQAIKQNIANQQFDLAEKRMDSLIAGIPFAEGQQLVEQAMASGQGVAMYKGIPIPLGKLVTGVEQVRKDTQALEQASLANSLFGMNEKLQKLVTTNSAMALTNPKAAQNLRAINQFRQGVNLQDPFSVQRFSAFLDHMQTQTTDIVKQATGSYKSPEAKAAFEEFATTGVFSPQGAPAVAAEALRQPGIGVKGKLAPVWELYRNEAAKQIQSLNPSNMPNVNLNSNTGASQLMAWAFRNPNKKVDDIFTEVMQGGQFNEQADILAKNIFRKDALKSVLDSLSTAPGPGATVYLNLIRDKSKMTDANGDVDPEKLATYLAQQSALNGGRADYAQTFVDALRTYATQADSITADPSLTTEDLSLMSTIYGTNPTAAIMSNFIQVMAINAQRANENMQKWIQEDVTGVTQRRFLSQFDPEILADQKTRQGLLAQTPSATGIGLADEFKAIYGTDPRFGSAASQNSGR